MRFGPGFDSPRGVRRCLWPTPRSRMPIRGRSRSRSPTAAKAAKKGRAGDPANSFETVAREWHCSFSQTLSPGHAAAKLRRLELDVFPTLGARPIDDIKAADVLRVLRRMEDRGALEMAHRIRGIFGEVFRYAVVAGRADRDPTADLKGALPPAKTKHLAAITDPKEVGPLLRAIDAYKGSSAVKWALQLAPLVFVRPGELRQAEWTEFDLDAAEWTIPAERMKMRQPHLVPLSAQAVAILRQAQGPTGNGLGSRRRNPLLSFFSPSSHASHGTLLHIIV